MQDLIPSSLRRIVYSRRDFAYQHLDKDKREIRLLHLLPARTKSQPIVAKLSHVSLDESPKFDALSYMWGDPTPVDFVHLRHGKIPIAANLATAFRHIRSTEQRLTIWIDALCINQKDLEERSQQVQLMRKIYQQANLVRIWVNEAIDPRCPAVLRLQDKAIWIPGNFSALGKDPEIWWPVVSMFRNEYWGRVWVQQEVINATRLQLHYQDIIIYHDVLVLFQELMDTRFNDPSYQISAWQDVSVVFASADAPALEIASFRRHSESVNYAGNPRSLLYMLQFYNGLMVADERDRVYGLMHLANDYDEGSIVVDYNKSIVEVMIMTVGYHIRKHHKVDFLHQVDLRQTERKDLTPWPSWLPRWSRYLPGRFYPSSKLRATANTNCLEDAITADSKLCIQGFRVDAIRAVLPARDFGHTSILEIWQSFYDFTKVDLESGETSISEALWDIFTFRYPTSTCPTHAEIIQAMKALRSLAYGAEHCDRVPGWAGREIVDLLEQEPEPTRKAVVQLLNVLHIRSMVRTQNEYIGLMPPCDVVVGDEAWIIFGCDWPMILRPCGEDYIVVGPAYIPGFMRGEAIEDLSEPIKDRIELVRDGDRCGQWTVTSVLLV